jgi:hypothetical protein
MDIPVILREPNKIKVSELNNPFLFPNANAYQVGDGAILALATNAMNVSDQNYGQHPLFVFTTRGVWTLNVGTGEVVYTTTSSPTSEEIPVSGIVCETPYGVVFISRRGLIMINGRATEFLSPQLEQPALILTVEEPVQAAGVIFIPPTESFKEYLSGIRLMAYNPHESELIVCGGDPAYQYVYGLPSRAFYRSDERIDVVVRNAYPELYVTEHASWGFGDDHDTLKDYGRSETPHARVGLTLRPLQLGTSDVKKLDRMILRGLLYDLDNPETDKKALFLIHHSQDGAAFTMTRGLTRNPGGYKNIDMGLMARSKFRYFLFSFGGMLHEKSRIYLLESMVGKEYSNEKMR